jgi:hypothetical protein
MLPNQHFWEARLYLIRTKYLILQVGVQGLEPWTRCLRVSVITFLHSNHLDPRVLCMQQICELKKAEELG